LSALIRLLRRRGSVRTLVLLTLLALTGGTLLTLASLRPNDAEPIDRAAYDRLMSTRVQGLDDLMDWFYEQQDQWVRIIPPGLEELVQPGLPDVVVLDPAGKGWPESLQKALSGLKPTWRNSVPTYELELHESLNGEITISDTSGNVLYTVPTPGDYQVPYEALFRQSVNPLLYEPWLNRYKLRARITLLPQDSVEHYLFAQAEQEAYAQQQAVPKLPMMLMSGGSEELAISGMELLTNGFCLTVTYPASFSGQVWSVYQQNTPALNADLTNSFNGLESIWSLVFDSLVLTGETATSWTDTQPMGSDTNGNPLHRFYGVGSNEVDSDEDGLSNAVEQFIHHTLPGTSDTDGDNLPDGWEIATGLNPRSSVGVDGTSGDPDQDGLTNVEEWTLEADPMQFDTVILLGPDDLYSGGMLRMLGPSQGVQFRSLSTVRAKCGFAEFIPSEPPRIYSKSTKTGDSAYGYDHFDYPDWFRREVSDCAVTVVDPFSCTQACISSGSITHDAYRESDGMPCPSQVHHATNWSDLECGSEIVVYGTRQHDWDCGVEEVQFSFTVSPYSSVSATPTNPVYWEFSTNEYYLDETDNRLDYSENFSSEMLSEEYTTGQMLATALADLGRCDSLTSLPWEEGRMWGGACATNFAATAALRDLSTNEMQIALTKIGYRFRVANLQVGQIYRLNWVEMFTPAGSATSEVVQARTAVLRGTGNLQVIEDPAYVIEPPATNGVVEPVVLMVDFEARAGMINYGFDPKETVREDGPYPWASVDKDDESSVSKILIEPESIADQVELVVVSGGSSADIDPKTFTASSTDLTITGQGAAGNALVEARIGSSGPVCSKLNIMALPKRSLTVGIYYIEDSSFSGTSPVGGPSASAVVDVLNDVFSQAQIEFTLIESETVDIDYDDNQNGKLDEDEIDALVATPFWSGQVNGMFVKESGIPYPSDTNFMVRGVHLHEASGGVLCTANIGSYASLGIAHEIGHELFLATHNDDGGGHDAGPWPDGEESLMRSGSPVNGVLPNPGRWLRHEDWKTANDEAANQ